MARPAALRYDRSAEVAMWFWLAGCGDPGTTSDADDPVGEPTAETGAPSTADTGGPDTGFTPVAPAPDLPSMQRSVQQALDELPELSIRPCVDAWNAVSSSMTARCPRWSEHGDQDTWVQSGCLDDAGLGYVGSITFDHDLPRFVDRYLYGPLFVEEGATVVPGYTARPVFEGATEGLMIASVGTVVDGPIDAYVSSGDFQSLTAEQDGLRLVWHGLRGLCRSVDPTDTWMDRLDPWLHVARLTPTDGPGVRAEVDGYLAGVERPYSTVAFDRLVLLDEALGATCPSEPAGAIDVRHEDGWTWRVTFGGDCDGCGQVEGGGELCVDFSPLLRPLAPTSDLVARVGPG